MKKKYWKTWLIPAWLVLILLVSAGAAGAGETGHDFIDPDLLPKQTEPAVSSSSDEAAASSSGEVTASSSDEASASSSEEVTASSSDEASASSSEEVTASSSDETAASSSDETAASSSDEAGTSSSGGTDPRLIIAEAAAGLFALLALVLAIRLRKSRKQGTPPDTGAHDPSRSVPAPKPADGKTDSPEIEDFGETELTRQRIDSYGETELVRERIDSYGETELVTDGTEKPDKPDKPGRTEKTDGNSLLGEYDDIPDFDRDDM